MRCEQLKIAGINFEYPVDESCHNTCHCQDQSDTFQPICDESTGLTFVNGCLAGCQDILNQKNSEHFNLTNCLCASSPAEILTSGKCQISCNLIPFMICLFLVTLAATSAQTPAIVATMNSVSNSERPLALGVQFLFYCCLAYIPAPIYFGKCLDKSCLFRKSSSQVLFSSCAENDNRAETAGNCLLFDSDMFRMIYFGLCVLVKFSGFIFMSICLKFSLKRDRIENENS